MLSSKQIRFENEDNDETILLSYPLLCKLSLFYPVSSKFKPNPDSKVTNFVHKLSHDEIILK